MGVKSNRYYLIRRPYFRSIAAIIILLALASCDLQDTMLYYPSF